MKLSPFSSTLCGRFSFSAAAVAASAGWILAISQAPAGVRSYEDAYTSGKSVSHTSMLELKSASDCFVTGPQFSLYGAGLIANGGGGLSGELDDDGLGGGFSAAYFVNDYAGLEFSATWLDGDSVINAFDVSAILRCPIPSLSIAPYITGGVGIHADSVNQAYGLVGGGIDMRFSDLFDCAGLFVDGRYVFADDTGDYTVVRAGIRTNF